MRASTGHRSPDQKTHCCFCCCCNAPTPSRVCRELSDSDTDGIFCDEVICLADACPFTRCGVCVYVCGCCEQICRARQRTTETTKVQTTQKVKFFFWFALSLLSPSHTHKATLQIYLLF